MIVDEHTRPEVPMSRVQLALNVTDLDAAIGFYSKLFATEPAKVRPGYANFAIAALEAGAAGSFMLSNRGPRILEAYSEEGAEVLSRLDIFVKDMGIVGKAVRHLCDGVGAGRSNHQRVCPQPQVYVIIPLPVFVFYKF